MSELKPNGTLTITPLQETNLSWVATASTRTLRLKVY